MKILLGISFIIYAKKSVGDKVDFDNVKKVKTNLF